MHEGHEHELSSDREVALNQLHAKTNEYNSLKETDPRREELFREIRALRDLLGLSGKE
jgi:hypothetical protein